MSKISINENNCIELTNNGETLVITMRDSGFEFTYEGKKYEAKKGIIEQIENEQETIDFQHGIISHIIEEFGNKPFVFKHKDQTLVSIEKYDDKYFVADKETVTPMDLKSLIRFCLFLIDPEDERSSYYFAPDKEQKKEIKEQSNQELEQKRGVLVQPQKTLSDIIDDFGYRKFEVLDKDNKHILYGEKDPAMDYYFVWYANKPILKKSKFELLISITSHIRNGCSLQLANDF